MENEKPFKTIEVVDSRTKQVCKVACMSCIRGHRTTACGIPVCRTKIFWTVKRPGRPSNSCTCRYGATGGCKCVVARSACPHKSKKGEKRSGECRCDEQGRYCCLIEPDHWSALLALQKPTVDFFPSRDALEAKQTAITLPPTPHFSSALPSPISQHDFPGPPGSPPTLPHAPPNGLQHVHIMPTNYSPFPPIQTPLTPRFGLMGIGAPMGSSRDTAPDVLTWEGQAPLAPRDYPPPPPQRLYEMPPPDQRSYGQPATTPASSAQSPSVDHSYPQAHEPKNMSLPQLYTSSPGQTVNMSQLSPPPPSFNFSKLQADYFNYQLPNAICQNCGLNGCTCRNCPPVFQNFGTTSWAQCCGRKHARDVQLAAVPSKVARTENRDVTQSRKAVIPPLPPPPSSQQQQLPQQRPHPAYAHPPAPPLEVNGNQFDEGFQDLGLSLGDHPDLNSFDLDQHLLLSNSTDLADLSEFLLSDLDSSHDRAAAATTSTAAIAPTEEDEADGGGGGCCCRG